MNKKLREKINEALSSVLPITIIIFLLSVSFVPIPIGTTVMFIVGASMLIVGMGFFSLGADMAMLPLGEGVGAAFFRLRKLPLIAFISFLIGFIITIAEPDLQVLADQVPSIPDVTLILTVAAGVGFFLVVAIMRIIFKVALAHLLLLFYLMVFAVSRFTPSDFISIAFDSGGVTTGPITVPFIMAIGVGLATVRSDKNSMDDSFGLISLCSIGPILAVMLLGMVFKPTEAAFSSVQDYDIYTTRDVALAYAHSLPHFVREVLFAFAPIVLFFMFFQLVSRYFSKRQIPKILIGFVYTFIGLVLFLTGVNVGFIPVGHLLGSQIAATSYKWALLPLGALIGYYIVAAEPAVHVLNKQVEEVSNGAISQKAMNLSLSIGVAISLALSMLRILTSMSIYWLLIPCYAIALALTFFVPKIFTGIAFDSGGVASGPMTTTFLIPMAIGACESVGGNVLSDAFGIVAMVAMTPLVTIQIMGMIYTRQMKASESGSPITFGVTEVQAAEDKPAQQESDEASNEQ